MLVLRPGVISRALLFAPAGNHFPKIELFLLYFACKNCKLHEEQDADHI
jgi:hypothetical protein